MAIPSDVQDAMERLDGGYNNDAYNASTNPLGFSNGGHRHNLFALTGDVVEVGEWMEGVAEAVDADQQTVAADKAIVADDKATVTASAASVADNKAAVDAALAAVAGGPVISINGKTGVVFTDPTTVTDVLPTLDWRLNALDGAPFRYGFSRATAGGYRLNAKGVYVPTGINEPVIDYGADGKPKGTGFFGAYTNILLNSAALSTQTVTVSALTYTLSFRGTGSVTLSGAATGVLAGVEANNRVSLTFAASAGTLTVTVAGSVVEASLTATAFSVPYVPTTSAAVVRNADSMVISGADFTDFFNPAEGTVFVDYGGPTSGYLMSLTRGVGSSGPRVQLSFDGNGFPALAVINDALALVVQIRSVSAAPGRIAVSYKADDFKLSHGGAAAVVDTSGDLPTALAALEIGRSPTTTNQPNGYVRRLIYWPKALNATSLERMTA